MRKIVMSAVALTALMLASSVRAENEEGFFFKPYGGLDYQYVGINFHAIPGSTLSYDDVASSNLHGFHVHVGARVHKYAGIEAGYLWTGNGTKENVLGSGVTTKIHVRGFTFDGMGYLPVGQRQALDLIGTIGLSVLSGKAEASVPGISSSVDETEVGFRAGGGFQIWLTDHINTRAIVRYQTADFKGTVDSAVLANIGLNYQF